MRRLILTAILLLPVTASADVVRAPSQDQGRTCSSRPCTYAVSCARGCIADEIQRALIEAQAGDTITLEAGQTWDISRALTLYRKDGAEVLTVRTATPDERLPAGDTRITPTYVRLLPTLRGITTGRIIEVEQTRNAVENYRFLGLHLTTSDQVDVNDMVRLWAPGIHTEPAFTPNNIEFDRCIVRGHPLRSVGKGIRLFVRNGVVKNSFIDEIKAQNDSQAVTNFNGPGPLIIQNSYLSATGENFMTGGGIPDIRGNVPRDHTLEFNAFVKDPAQLLREQWRPNMYVRRGKIVTWGRGNYKAFDSGYTGSEPPAFPLTTINRAPSNPLTLGYVRPVSDECNPEFCVRDNGIRWVLSEAEPAPWAPGMTVKQGDIVSYRGPETENRTVTYYAAQDGVTGVRPPFTWPMLRFNPSPSSCSPEFCLDDGTTRWQRYQGSNVPWWVNKNLLEFKVIDGAIVRWNFFSGSWSDGQSGYGLNLKPENQDPANSWIARTENIEFAHNVMVDVERPFAWGGKGDYRTGVARNWKFHNNLIYGLRPNRNSAILSVDDANAIEFTQNTMVLAPGATLFSVGGLKKDNLVMTDNILQRGSFGIKRGGIAEGIPSLQESYETFTFTNNIVEGLPSSGYPPGNFNIALTDLGFLNPARGDFRLPFCSGEGGNCSQLKRFSSSLLTGKNVGADPDLLPQARDFAIHATDRAALIYYNLTQPVAHIPCAIEVSRDPDFSTFISDLDPERFARPDTDRHDQHIMIGEWRMFRLGKNVPLSPETTYHYRLHCGGELRTGEFTTAPAKEGTTSLRLRRGEDPPAEVENAIVEYGFSYSRETDTIPDSVRTEPFSCKSEGNCKVDIEVPRGTIVYYRFVDRAEDGTVLQSFPVVALPVD